MSKRFWLLAVLLLSVLCTSAIAQPGRPRIIDCHIHYNGDPEFIHKLLSKLDSVDGLAFLLVPPADLATAMPPGSDNDHPYSSPHFWAAFVLSGDPD